MARDQAGSGGGQSLWWHTWLPGLAAGASVVSCASWAHNVVVGSGQAAKDKPNYRLTDMHYCGRWVLPWVHSTVDCWQESHLGCVGAQLEGLAVAQASDRIQGLIQAHKQLHKSWLLVCSPMPPQSYSKACTCQWRPVTVVRLAVCKCTAGWASPKCTHGGGVRVEGLGWHLTIVQLRGLGWLLVQFPGSFGSQREEVVGRDSDNWCQQMPVHCGVKAGENCRGSMEAKLAIDFFSGKSCWVSLQRVLLHGCF